MADLNLSLAEKTCLLHDVDENFRLDGRERLDYRFIELETGVLDQVNGSARVVVGNTDIAVGVKVEIDTPSLDRPSEGKIEFFTDCSANANPDFEGKGGEDLATEISNALSLAYQSPDVLDLRQFSILPFKKCWKLFVDILILECGGNLYDVISLAVKAALYSTEIPKVKGAMLDGGEADIVLSDDIYECIRLDVKNFPVFVTLCKIGDHCLVDPLLEEEACCSASLVMSVLPSGRISSTIKMGYGSLLPSTLIKFLEIGTMMGKKLNDELVLALQAEEDLGPKRQIKGFLG